MVGLDTAPLIYFIEKNQIYLPFVRPFFKALDEGRYTAVTSTITIIETLVLPIRTGNHDIAQRYKEILLNSSFLSTFDVTPDIAQKAAEIRALYNFRTPDAIQLATAIIGGATFFLTNDEKFDKYPELTILLLDRLVV